MTDIENPICQFQNCNRVANYRKSKVGNCHLKDTKYEFCGYHRSINSINKRFPYKSIFDKINIELKYYNHQNEHIVHEFNDHINKLLKNHKFKFPIKITVFTENIVNDYSYDDQDINVSKITNYKKYFDKDVISKKDIYDIIREFQKYYNEKKIVMLYIHMDKEYDIYDIIKEFRKYYEEKNVNDIIKEFKDYYKQKKVKFDNIFKLLIDFREYYNQKEINIKKFIKDFRDYYNQKKLEMLIDKNDYDELLIQFDEFDYKIKDDLSKKIKFDEKYNRKIYLELCDLIGYQIDKVTKSFEILNENDIESTLTNIRKNIDENFEKLSKNSRDKFLCFKKLEINIFKYQALKNTWCLSLNYLKVYKDKD